MNSGDVVLMVAGLLWAIGYFISCVLHPYALCKPCKGRGKHTGSIYGGHRDCHICSGKGQRRKAGAFLLRRGEPRQKSSRIAPRTYK